MGLPMRGPRVIVLTLLAMLAFAGNSLLTRAAFHLTSIDAASFTSIRLLSGALALWLVVALRRPGAGAGRGNWLSALALFAYAAGFSYAYLGLTAATGALLLFGTVQVTMIGYGLMVGDRLGRLQWLGFMLAFAGLVGLLMPGLAAPSVPHSTLMLVAGVAWGAYSLRGKGRGDPTRVTTGNFTRALAFTLPLSLLMLDRARLDMSGVGYAIASGALTSGLGYAIWYMALPGLRAATAATVQLSVPVLTALGGILLLGEALSLRLVLAGSAVLGGIALVILVRKPPA